MSDADEIKRLNAALEGRYRIERKVGEGGMATVYLADDVRHERKVALKVLKPELAAVVGAERFLAEIKTTANLQHPHILPLFDSGEADGFLFYVMPYVEGESLRDRIDREHQLSVDDAVKIACDMAEALDYAHRQGIIHRDIKPANVLLLEGQPVLSDFGIALAVGAAGGGRLTETGISLGTPHYMSPEQATGDTHVGAATDIYAVGCVLYEMLVGEPPFTGSTPQAVLGKIVTGTADPVGNHRRSVPIHVQCVVERGLEKIPADRFPNARSVVEALDDPNFRHGEARGIAPTTAGPWKNLSFALALTAVVFGGVAAWSLLRPGPRQMVTRFLIPLEPNFEHGLALSPDGSIIVLGAPHEQSLRETVQLRRRRIDELAIRDIPGTEGMEVVTPAVSPDGSEVAFTADTELRVVPIEGGVSRTLADSTFCCPVWDSADDIYFTASDGRIYRVPPRGGAPRAITTLRPEDAGHYYFQVIPGTQRAIFWARRVDGENRIERFDLSTGDRKVLLTGVFPQVLQTGHLMVASLDGRLLTVPLDLESADLAGAPVLIAENLSVDPVFETLYYDVSANGSLAYVVEGSSGSALPNEFVWVTRSGAVESVDPGWSFRSPQNPGWQLSPDDSKIVFAQTVETGQEVWTKDLPDGPLARVSFGEEGGAVFRPFWTPDGTRVMYFGGPSFSDRNLWTRRIDGVGETRLFLDPARPVVQGSWSPDGTVILMRTGGTSAMGRGRRDIVAFRPGRDTSLVPLIATQFEENSPTLSPNGRWLAYASDYTGRSEIYVRPFPNVDSTRVRISTDGGLKPVWAHSGTELLFVDAQRRMVSARFEPDSGEPSAPDVLFSLPPDFVLGPGADFFDVTRDDQRFLMVRSYRGGSGGGLDLVVVQNFVEELEAAAPN